MKKSLFAFCLILFTASLGLAMTTEYQLESKTQKVQSSTYLLLFSFYRAKQHRNQQPNDHARDLSRVRQPANQFFKKDIY